MSEESKALPGDEVIGMRDCDKGRIGDGHGCYYEALLKQQREAAKKKIAAAAAARGPI